jgi:hypothetical protein
MDGWRIYRITWTAGVSTGLHGWLAYLQDYMDYWRIYRITWMARISTELHGLLAYLQPAAQLGFLMPMASNHNGCPKEGTVLAI